MKRRGFDYKAKKYSNPFFGNGRRNYSRPITFFFRPRVIIFFVLAFAGGVVWLFFFSPVFSVKSIDIQGAGRVSAAELKIEIWKQTNKKRMLLGSQGNIFLFNSRELSLRLQNEYNLANLSVKKKLFSTITVNLKEKDCAVIWRESENDYCLDSNGNEIFSAPLGTIIQTDCPLIHNLGNVRESNAPKTESKIISYASKLRDELKSDKYGIKLGYFIVDDNEPNSLMVVIANGPKIYFNTGEDMNEQLTRLAVLKEKTLKDDFIKKEYIDLRYGNKVYYK